MIGSKMLLVLGAVVPCLLATGTVEEEKAFFAQVDKDHSDDISQAEFLEYLWGARNINMTPFQHADKDKNGKVEGEELKALESEGRTFEMIGQHTGSMQTDGAGKEFLGEKDYQDAVRTIWMTHIRTTYGEADKNKDGKMIISEFIPIYDKLAEEAKKRHFETTNGNNNDHLDLNEWKGMIYHGHQIDNMKQAETFFRQADKDGDNILSLVEYLADDERNKKEDFDKMVPTANKLRVALSFEEFNAFLDHEFHEKSKSSFEKADTDKDGKVTKEEFEKSDHFTHLVRMEL